MQHSISFWNAAKSPNYKTNVDLLYPYSEVPYIGNYKLVKIPIATDDIVIPANELIEHVDYWGEGKITVSAGTSGFSSCYNVNHQYQLVSNGTDRDTKIPNRIPVISYTNCSTSSYIKDNSVKLVTLMGAPINKSCAKDIARIVNNDLGKIVIYGFPSNATEIKNIEEALAGKSILFCHGYSLSDLLKTITLFEENDFRAYINVFDMNLELYNKVLEGSYENAVNISKTLENSGNGRTVVEVVARLLREANKNIMAYACKLWNNDAKDMVKNYFPISFNLIFEQADVKIINKKNMFAMKLDSADKIAIGDSKDKESNQIIWKMIPIWENNDVYFKIFHKENQMYLQVDDGEGDRNIKGSTEALASWILDPVKVDDDLLFYIISRDANQGLKLAEEVDSTGNKKVLTHHGTVLGEPEKYGWYIAPL